MADYSFSELTPTAFLERSARVFGDRIAIVDQERNFSYAEFYERAGRLAGGLAMLGVKSGDRVAALCVNSHVMLELHNGVPMCGAVLVPLNIRLSAHEMASIIEHSGARMLVVNEELAELGLTVAQATSTLAVVAGGAEDEYEELLTAAAVRQEPCADERGLLAINYTSGTTGRPKGVMYHHRGAYLQSLAMAMHSGLTADSVYLWTLPMFHCNGWCFTWAVTAAGARHICLRAVDVAEIWRALHSVHVTHFSAAPTVLNMIAAAKGNVGPPLGQPVRAQTGGAPPSPTLLATMAELNIDVTHLYGLTETFGPVAINDWRSEWSALPPGEQAALKARQGVSNVIAERLRVIADDGSDVPADGATIGEIVTRGNDVMLGYYNDPTATDAVSVNGWLRTGDLAVKHPDGYVEIKDRSKDIIISGGENIASVEVERVIDAHPGVLESAVVGRQDDKWGEVPVAFVTLRPGAEVSVDEIRDLVRRQLAHFKAPRDVIFCPLPKTSTGKIQKSVLRTSLSPNATEVGVSDGCRRLTHLCHSDCGCDGGHSGS